ncbi:hypothetical protein [Bosea sp. (in: a-proteobacteria)]|jgi:hypothetical protein|uniref:hypothetical protein n=1 Tax=Bosea sp. (in: a-proteobacteria) TaxID=1871050 RepID=UPI003561E407
MTEINDRIARLDLIGSAERPTASVTPDQVLAEVLAILAAAEFACLTADERSAVLYRLHLIYSGSWHVSGLQIIPAVERAAQALFADNDAPLAALCVAYDLLFFLYWCWYTSADQQVSFGADVVAPFCAAIAARKASAPTAEPSKAAPARRVGYLAQFVSPGPGNAIAGANAVILRALAAASPDAPPILYAWLFHDPETLAAYAALGIEIRPVTGNSTAERIDALRLMIAADAPDVLITDMNTALPTALFMERVAPIQIFYQFGMPIWPVPQVDAVFHVWDFDRAKAGLAHCPHLRLTIPYDLARFAGPADPEALASERAALPSGRLIGTYGRLSKITPAFVEAAAAGIARHPDVTVVFGGSGDGGPIRDKIDAMGLSQRFLVLERFVDGHVWGDMLDIFLDTFPQPGGASCLEVIAKGKPVVGLVTSEASNLARDERVASLVASDAAGYARILDRILADPCAYAQACEETRGLAARYPDEASYRAKLAQAIDRLRRGRDPNSLRELFGRMARRAFARP